MRTTDPSARTTSRPDEVVAGQPARAHQDAQTAAEGETADPGHRDHTAGGRQPVRLGRGVEVSPGGAAAGAGDAPLGVDLHLVHLGQVDHQTVVDHGEPGGVVPATADRDLESVLAGEVHRRHDVFCRAGTSDCRRTAVDHPVPDVTSLLVARLSGRSRSPPIASSRELQGREEYEPGFSRVVATWPP